jgi:putative hydrolase of the HAD superfamily
MMKKTYTNIFFDLDHTLWDFDKNSELAFDKIFKLNFPEINTESFIKEYIPINQACWKLYQKDKITHQELRYKRLKDSFDCLNITITDDDIDKIATDYLEYLPENNHLFEGAVEILDYLKPNYNLHIITNGFAAVQEKKLVNSGIKNYFQTITNSELAGVKKPNPIIYDFALNASNAKKENSIMIGDCIDADVLGAIYFGMDAVFINHNNVESIHNVKEVRHLLDLKSLF